MYIDLFVKFRLNLFTTVLFFNVLTRYPVKLLVLKQSSSYDTNNTAHQIKKKKPKLVSYLQVIINQLALHLIKKNWVGAHSTQITCTTFNSNIRFSIIGSKFRC